MPKKTKVVAKSIKVYPANIRKAFQKEMDQQARSVALHQSKSRSNRPKPHRFVVMLNQELLDAQIQEVLRLKEKHALRGKSPVVKEVFVDSDDLFYGILGALKDMPFALPIKERAAFIKLRVAKVLEESGIRVGLT